MSGLVLIVYKVDCGGETVSALFIPLFSWGVRWSACHRVVLIQRQTSLEYTAKYPVGDDAFYICECTQNLEAFSRAPKSYYFNVMLFGSL